MHLHLKCNASKKEGSQYCFPCLEKNDTDLNKAHAQVEDAETQNPIEKNETRKFHERWYKV